MMKTDELANRRSIVEAQTMALFNVIKCCEHVLKTVGAPDDVIKGFLDGDTEHVIWWIDNEYARGVPPNTNSAKGSFGLARGGLA